MSEFDYNDALEDAKRDSQRNEDYYNSAMCEVMRLRNVARNYSDFYNKVRKALESNDLQAIGDLLNEYK